MKNFSQLEFFLDPILVLTSDLKVLYCNRSVESFLKQSEKRIFEKNILDLIQFDEKTMKDIQTLSVIQNRLIEWTSKNKDTGSAFVSFYKYDEEKNLYALYLKDQSVEAGLYSQTRNYIKKLEEYSQELENRVQERTKEVFNLSKNQTALLNSVTQGFLIFNKEDISIIHSKAFSSMFEIKGEFFIHKILKLDKIFFDSWVSAMYEEVLPFEDIKDLGPKVLKYKDKTISLSFFPIRKDTGSIESIVLVTTDISDKVYLEEVFEQESQKSKQILSILKRKDQMPLLIKESKNIIEKLFINPNDMFSLHTLKGVAGSFYLKNIADYIHNLEGNIKNEKKVSFADIRYISEMMDGFQGDVENIIGPLNEVRLSQETIDQIYKTAKNQQDLLKLKSILEYKSIKSILIGYNDMVQNLAQELGKKVDNIHFNGDFKIDQNKYQAVINSFVHIFKNIVDHGIESSEERQKRSKSIGKISILLEEKSDSFYIEISDNGSGIDLDKIKAKFNGLELSDNECLMKIFDNFSSKDTVTQTSGRGIGLSAVKYAIENIGGNICVTSQKGVGTTFKIVLPK